MVDKSNPKSKYKQTNIYQIRVDGHLDPQWANWFGGLTITLEKKGTTLIIGPVIDDAALHGLLKKVRDSGLRLLSVNSVETDGEEDNDHSGETITEEKNNKEGAE